MLDAAYLNPSAHRFAVHASRPGRGEGSKKGGGKAADVARGDPRQIREWLTAVRADEEQYMVQALRFGGMPFLNDPSEGMLAHVTNAFNSLFKGIGGEGIGAFFFSLLFA